MFARITWGNLPQSTTLEQVATNYAEQIAPPLKTQDGFLGSSLLVNPETGEGVTASYWATAEAMTASEAVGNAVRAQATQATGAVIGEVDRFEQLLEDRVAQAAAGTFARINDVMTSPGQLDAAVAFLRETAVPAARAMKGYRSSRAWANRETGRLVVSTVWETAADRLASEATMSGLRRQAAEVAKAQTQVKVGHYDVVVVEATTAPQQAPTTTTTAG